MITNERLQEILRNSGPHNPILYQEREDLVRELVAAREMFLIVEKVAEDYEAAVEHMGASTSLAMRFRKAIEAYKKARGILV